MDLKILGIALIVITSATIWFLYPNDTNKAISKLSGKTSDSESIAPEIKLLETSIGTSSSNENAEESLVKKPIEHNIQSSSIDSTSINTEPTLTESRSAQNDEK